MRWYFAACDGHETGGKAIKVGHSGLPGLVEVSELDVLQRIRPKHALCPLKSRILRYGGASDAWSGLFTVQHPR